MNRRFTGKTAKWLALGMSFGLAAAPGGLVHNWIGPHQFGLRTTFGATTSEVLKSGPHVHVPFAQYTHSYDSQVQRIEFNAGGWRFLPFGDSTGDHNALQSDMVLNYRVLPDLEKLGYHRWAMDGIFLQDGFWLLTKLMNDSANAVMGKSPMAGIPANPEKYLQDFREDFAIRIGQNNVPIHVESIELKGFNSFMPSRMVSYGKTAEAAPNSALTN